MSSVFSSSDSDERWLTITWELFDITTGKLDANAKRNDGEYPFFTCSDEIYINSYALTVRQFYYWQWRFSRQKI